MPKLVSYKNSTSQSDDWTLISDTDALPEDLTKVLLPLEVFLENTDKFDKCGVWLSSDQDVYALAKVLDKLSVVACDFQTFMDGRSFSQARILREHIEFSGDIRAVGHFIQDQMHYMLRCGFNEYLAFVSTLRESAFAGSLAPLLISRIYRISNTEAQHRSPNRQVLAKYRAGVTLWRILCHNSSVYS